MVSFSRIWNNAKANKNDESIGTYSAPIKKKGEAMQRYFWDIDAMKEEIRSFEVKKRSLPFRGLANLLKVPRSTVYRLFKDEDLCKRRSVRLKPFLTDQNKLMRCMYAYDRLRVDRNRNIHFDPSFNEVHLDEKWFYLFKQNNKYFLLDDEELPARATKHKSHIPKVMFLVAVARPRFDVNGVCTFDGKIGYWPFSEMRPAERTSANRVRGTMEDKSINVDAATYTRYVLEYVMPAIKLKFPQDLIERETKLTIQHDNAPSHFMGKDMDWRAFQAAHENNRWTFVIGEQPANSPDCNVLDLGFFNSVQSLYWQQETPNDIAGLIAAFDVAWDQYSANTLNRIWLTHGMTMEQILLHHGDNNFVAPHINKDRLEIEGNLPVQIYISQDAVDACALIKLYR